MLSSFATYVTNKVYPQPANNIPFELSENYKLFEAKYQQHSIRLPQGDEWIYYDTKGCVSSTKPLILIPGTTGTAQVFFQQLLNLGLRGYRLISVTIPTTSTVQLFIESFITFVTRLNIKEFHLLGTSLGGYLALSITEQYPSRVISLILTHSFINTRLFQANAPWISSEIMPQFYLRSYLTEALTNETKTTAFVLKQVDSLSREELVSRLSLNFSKYCIDKINYPQQQITIIDVYDGTSLDQGMKEELYMLLDEAKYSLMKHGGDFPYLSNHEEYTMLIRVHLRRNQYNKQPLVITEDYTINDEKKKQYLMDKKIKKTRYKAFLNGQRKEYKKYLIHKEQSSIKKKKKLKNDIDTKQWNDNDIGIEQYNDDDNVMDSFIPELGDYDFQTSEVVPWSIQENNGDDKQMSLYSSNALLHFVSQHKVDQYDENIGDSRF